MRACPIALMKLIAIVLAAAFSCQNTVRADDSGAGAGESPSALPQVGKGEKIRFFFSQWHHFAQGGVSDEELMSSLGKVGATVFVDWGCNPQRGELAHKYGIKYYCGFSTVRFRDPAKEHNLRLAVSLYGKTCPEAFEQYKAEGGDITESWGKYGEGAPAYIPCPLQRLPWDKAMIEPMKEHVQNGLVDGLHMDFEPYGAYHFDITDAMLCYCDDCFARWLSHKGLDSPKPRDERYEWLKREGLLYDYLGLLRTRMEAMLQEIAGEMRAIRPDFGFSSYPGFSDDLHEAWRMQAVAVGLNAPEAPYIVVDSTPYWEDPHRPWWDSSRRFYQQLGVRHVMGSWDAGIMGQHNESHVGAGELMYELAMATDGYWRWGERQYDTDDWRSFAYVNQKLRQMESRLGEYLLKGQRVDHFVTLVEQTGTPRLERALVADTWEHGGRYLTRLFNGNKDYPLHLRVRFPHAMTIAGGKYGWRLRDPVYDMDFARRQDAAGGTVTWSNEALHEGVVVMLHGREELFLLAEPAAEPVPFNRSTTLSSFDLPTHRPRPQATEALPEAEATAGPDAIVCTPYVNGPCAGQTTTQCLTTTIHRASATKKGQGANLFTLSGYCHEPTFSPDARTVMFTAYVNGKGQIYLVNATGGPTRNLSNNDYCDRGPRFSPDGKTIVFVSDRDGDWEIYSMAIDGTGQRRLTHSPAVDRSPSVSPDGRQIAYICNEDGDFDVYIINIDGSGRRVALDRAGNEYEPTWSPDGSEIACTIRPGNHRWICLIKADGSGRRFIGQGFTDTRSIRYSPDGTKIAAAFTEFGESGVFVVDIESKQVTRLVQRASNKAMSDAWYTTGTGSPRYVSRTFSGVQFSPDGQTVLYCGDGSEDRQFKLYTIPVSGGEPTAVEAAASGWPMETDWARK